MHTPKAKIFLAAERHKQETDWFRSYRLFNFGPFQNRHKQPVGNLLAINDDTLAGQGSIRITAEEDMLLLLLPVVGAVVCSNERSEGIRVEAGELLIWPCSKETTVVLHNPYEQELVNFLQIWLQAGSPLLAKPEKFSFDTPCNGLSKIATTHDTNFFLGKFDGREEGTFSAKGRTTLFAYIIAGAFEVEGRLLQTGDGFMLWEADEVSFEALSNEAIVLLIELPADA